MVHWQDQFQQSQKGGLFLPQSLQVSRKQQVSPAVCPLCHQPHGREDQSGNHRPSVDDGEGWKQYWANKSQSWRTKPEISCCRQHELSQRRLIPPEPESGIYPFGETSLNRADVEWLLATHENGRGPVDWDDESQRGREGLDLRGAHLVGEDLQGLPLERTRFTNAHLERTRFTNAHLERTRFTNAKLNGADLMAAHLEGAILAGAQLERANLVETHLEGASLSYAQLEEAMLFNAKLNGADLSNAQLKGVSLLNAQLNGADLSGAKLNGADLSNAQLKGANLSLAKLEDVQLATVTLENEQGIGPTIVDVSWAGTNMSVINWLDIVMLGDEDHAHQMNDDDGNKKGRETRWVEYHNAMRATHQLAIVLQDQGLTADASRFAYRAKRLERMVRWYKLRTITWRDQNSRKRTAKSMRKGLIRFFPILLSWLFSWFLFLIAGYGYRLRFCFFWYFLVVLGFAFAYLFVEPHYFIWWTALGESVNVFHGRGASPNIPQLTHPARFAMLTVAEAWAGLVIEVVFVATLIQRFFGK